MIVHAKRWWGLGALGAALAAYFLANPPRLEHAAVLGLLVGLLVATPTTRSLGITLVPAAAFGLLYDGLHLFQERSYDTVVIEPIWRIEAALFGWIGTASQPLGPVDVFREHNWAAVDALGAVVYSVHLVPAFVYGSAVWWLAFRERNVEGFDRVSQFWWGFLALNILAFAVHVLMPVAPPWYVIEYGFAPPTEPLVGNPAGLARVDALLGYGHFEGVYGNAKYVFGALPSLHVAVPAWVALRTDGTWRAAGMWFFTAVMAFYAVYFAHHYIVDLVAGVGMAIFVHAMLESTRAGDVAVWLGRELRRTLGDPSLTTTTPAEEAA